MMSDNVTTFPGGVELPENTMQVAPRQPGWCQHTSIVLDEHTRSIQCADPKCGATLDAFNYLLYNARSISHAWSSHRQVMQQANEVAQRVAVLKKEEQRLRAMVKRLQEKSGAVVSVRSRETL